MPAAIAVGGASLVLILALGRRLPRVPGVFVAVVASIAASVAFDLASHGVKLVGTLPQGLPPFTVPGPHVSDLPLLAAGAAGIALVALTDTISTASAFAARTGQEVNGNGEMIGIGTANVATGFFQGFPVSTSASRTAVAEQAGAKTQLTGRRRGSADRADAACWSPDCCATFPSRRSPRLSSPPRCRWPTSRRPCGCGASGEATSRCRSPRSWAWRCSAYCPASGSPSRFSIFDVFRHVWWPYHTTLGRVPGMRGYHDRQEHPDAEVPPGLVIFRFDAPLLFANARTFREHLRHFAASDPPPTWIVIAAEPITDVDTTAADMLLALDEELNAKGISIIFAELKHPIRAKLERYELIGPLDPSHFYPTVHAAVDAYERPADETSRSS